MNEQNEQQEEEQKVLPMLWAEMKRAWQSKKVRAVLVLFIFLVIIGGVVPAGKLPFLRHLAYAMGYTSDEANEISLLKALLTWNDHSKRMRGELDDPDEVGLFGSDGGYAAARARLEQNKKSSLINMRALNAQLASEGKRRDLLKGSYYEATSDEGNSKKGVRVNADGPANTQANNAKVGEVYFGSDANTIARDPKDGYNSTASLKKIANPNIKGSAGQTDWLQAYVNKATMKDAGLNNLSKNLEMGGTLAQLAPIEGIGNHRAQKDMYYAWLTGMSARRTPNLVLKKTLASAAFDGADMPKKVFDSSGFSGIGIDPDDVVSDLDNIKVRLKNEKMCEEAQKTSGEKYTTQLKSASDAINGLSSRFPKTCSEVDGSFSNNLSALRNQCEQVKIAFNDVSTYCGIATKAGREGTCTTNNLQDRYDQYANYCDEENKRCRGLETPEEQKACLDEIKSAADYDGGDCRNGGCSQGGVEQLVRGTFNVSVNGSGVDPNAGDFFPEMDWGASNFY